VAEAKFATAVRSAAMQRLPLCTPRAGASQLLLRSGRVLRRGYFWRPSGYFSRNSKLGSRKSIAGGLIYLALVFIYFRCLDGGSFSPHRAAARHKATLANPWPRSSTRCSRCDKQAWACNELNPKVFKFHAGSGRQPAPTVLGEGGASGLLGGPFES
jgi:hypothetical protein